MFLAEKWSFRQLDMLTEFSGETLLDYKEINVIIEPSAERLFYKNFCRKIKQVSVETFQNHQT